jgi:hypothetical protein
MRLSPLLLLLAPLTACGPTAPPQPRTVFQCVTAAVACDPHVSGEAWCRTVKTSTEINEARHCRGLRWAFPAEARPMHTSVGMLDTLWFKRTQSMRTSEGGDLYDDIQLKSVEYADLAREVESTRSAFAMNQRGEDLDGHHAFESAPHPVTRNFQLVLLPREDADYYLQCTARTSHGRRMLLGRCSVSLQVRPLAQIQYYLRVEHIGRVREENAAFRRALDGYLLTPNVRQQASSDHSTAR